jgi:LPXTG-motif cell wall-anchored protein
MTHRIERLVLLVAVACGVASFAHFSHNAEFCGDYPNLPAWITRGSVWLAWAGITLLGGAGFWLFRTGRRKSGLGVLAAYGALGCDGLGHYSLAPMARHTAMMNFAIWFEVMAGATLVAVALGALVLELRRHGRLRPA